MKAGLTHLCAALLPMMTPALAAADDAEWLVAPYLWFSDVTLDQSSGVSGGISASDLLASVGYRFNKTFALILGYRHLDIEFEENISGEVETTDITLSGPMLGFLYRF